MFHRILVGMDNSASSQQIFEQALVIAKATNASMMLLHVLSAEEEGCPENPLHIGYVHYSGVSAELMKKYQQQLNAYEEKGLELLRQRVAEAEAEEVSVEFTQTPGSPGKTICALAGNWNADLIVLGRRGRSGLTELLLGSVSNYVTHHAPCSVLTVQGRVKLDSSVDGKAEVTTVN